MSDTNIDVNAVVGGEPPATEPKAPETEPEKTPEEAPKLTQAQVDEIVAKRLEQYSRKQFGGEGAEVKAKLSKLAELEAAEEKRARERMSERERLEADIQRERASREKAEELLAEIQFGDRITQVAREANVQNIEYAKYLVEKAIDGLGDDAGEIDLASVFTEALTNPSHRAGLGIPIEQEVGATTTTQDPAKAPPKPAGDQKINAKNMTSEEWLAYKKSKGWR